MAKFTAVAAVLFIAGLVISLYSPQSAFGLLRDLGLAGLLASALWYGARAARRLQRRLLWKVRNKIIISYAFVGLIPVLILAFIGVVSFRLVFGQVSALYLENEIRIISDQLEDASHRIAFRLHSQRSSDPSQLLLMAQHEFEELKKSHAGLEDLRVYVLRQTASEGAFRPVGRLPETAPPVNLPEWVRSGFDGLVHDRGRLHFRSLERIQAARPLLLLLDLPFDAQVVEDIERRTSIQLTPPQSVAPGGERRGLGALFQGRGGWLNINWMHVVTPTDWATGSSMPFLDPDLSLFAISVPASQLYYNFYFSQETFLGQFLLQIVAVLGVIFILAEAVSLVIGVVIARGITRSIQGLYEGTRRIEKGEFGYEVPVEKGDQLGALAAAFNSMSKSISRLLSQLGEKERIEKELEIAREVQTQLFPRITPRVEHLDLAGECLPARMVSGDYYDFIPYGKDRLEVIIADISGKGISAALLMASLQSAIRTRMVYQASSENGGQGSLGRTVAAINAHLYSQTAADKFATLVLSVFDSESRKLAYCNAGHNPPLHFSNGRAEKLMTGGMACGLFQNREYSEEVIQLAPGDVVVFYTDGVVEAENQQGDQFEMERLEELVARNVFLTANDLQRMIMDEVMHFSRGCEQRDDITVVVLKAD